MGYERLKTEYLCYLMNRAQIGSTGFTGYLELCEILQDTEFIPILPMDENRSSDCRALREDFDTDYEDRACDILDGIYGENGTMMELLVVLAEKMNYDLSDSQFEAGTGKWFMELLTNTGLIHAMNQSFEQTPRQTKELVQETLAKIIFRTIEWNGQGGLFPLRWPRQDQRNTELVVQMNDYIAENYDIS